MRKRCILADSDYFRKVKKRSTIIKHNKDFLKYVLEPDVLFDHLQTTGCFTEDKITSLRRIGTRKDKNDELLFHLANFTSQKYLNFLQCLYVTNQLSAATVLQYGGGWSCSSIRISFIVNIVRTFVNKCK